MPGRAFNRYHRPNRIGEEVVHQIWHKRDRIRKPRLKKLEYQFPRAQLLEAVLSLKRQEQNARKGPVDIWKRDEHVIPARPNVQRIRLQSVLASRSRRNRKFLVPVVQVFLGEIKT